ncbi:MAG TPA: hypothetical protein VHD36_12015 [Pirellulales bacterium]|nr:hypothetical protein [Pirellulales bacterium]
MPKTARRQPVAKAVEGRAVEVGEIGLVPKEFFKAIPVQESAARGSVGESFPKSRAGSFEVKIAKRFAHPGTPFPRGAQQGQSQPERVCRQSSSRAVRSASLRSDV